MSVSNLKKPPRLLPEQMRRHHDNPLYHLTRIRSRPRDHHLQTREGPFASEVFLMLCALSYEHLACREALRRERATTTPAPEATSTARAACGRGASPVFAKPTDPWSLLVDMMHVKMRAAKNRVMPSFPSRLTLWTTEKTITSLRPSRV